MKWTVFILLCATVFAGSCGKGIFGDARVDGIVMDKTTTATILGATLYLLENDNSGNLFGSPSASYVIDSTVTDSKGEFEFSYNKVDGYSYYVNASKEHYIDNMVQTHITDLGIGLDAEVLMTPEAFLKIRIHNIIEYDPWDYLSFSQTNQVFYGNFVDTTVIFQTSGNSENRIVWGVINDGVSPASNMSEYIFCPAFDTIYYEILY